jgi:CBS domain-containing protein
VTDRDLRDKVVSKGKDLSTPVNEIMSVPHVRADAREYCFEAILRMVQHNVHHLLVMKDGKLTGILTNHDLMLLQGTSPLSIVKDIESQDSVEKLVPVSGKIDNIIGLLLNEGAKASNITRIITEINDRLIRKITEFAEAQTGPPPVSYCWVVFGSEGRKEQTFKMDQDNALIYADPGSPEQARHAEEYFEKFTLAARDGLIKCGFPACASDFMATNPLLRKSLSDWKRFFSGCIISPPADAPLNPASFMDFRAIYGEAHLLDVLKNHALSLAKDSGKFLRHLADLSIRNIPPIGLLKALVVEKSGEHKDNLDLKSKCMSPLVDIIRLFALEERITETSTIERIHILSERHTIVSENADELLHAFDFLLLIGIQHQFLQFQEGAFIDSMINPDNLTNLEKRIAKETFQLISKLQDLVSQHYKLSHI